MKILIIGKGFIGTELKAKLPTAKLLSHNEDWQTYIHTESPNLIVNAAGIVGQKKCKEAGEDTTFDANVGFAHTVACIAKGTGAKSLLFSTGGVYTSPHSTPKRETDTVAAPNIYIASKIAMEQRTKHLDPIIFRIPVVLGSENFRQDYMNRIRTWSWVQGCYISPLRIETLAKAVEHIAKHKVSGIFNIAEQQFHYLPDFVKQHHKELPIWDTDRIPNDFTQTHILDSDKARRAGILC